MRKELVFVLLALFLCAGCNGNKKKMNGEHDLDAANITLDDHTISFYYNWYGNPSVDGEMKHWMHPIAPAPGHSEMSVPYPDLMMTSPVIFIRSSERTAAMILKSSGNISGCI